MTLVTHLTKDQIEQAFDALAEGWRGIFFPEEN